MESFAVITKLYQEYGNSKYMIGEDITQVQHALQAAHIAKTCNAPPHIIIAMLLHDIGQLLGQDKCHNIAIEKLHRSHDDIGAKWMKKNNLPQCVYDVAQYHTLAKVILCDQDPSYLSKLSPASQESYNIQKQKYSSWHNLSSETLEIVLACRRIDDIAKVSDYTPGSIDSYADMYQEVISQNYQNHDISWIDNLLSLVH